MPPLDSPLEAYRRDLARLRTREQFSADDGEWLAAASLLQRYADSGLGERQMLARELARHLAPAEEMTFAGAGLRLALTFERHGAMQFAMSWLELLERIVPASSTHDRGRILARRAQLLRKNDHMDEAIDLYEEVDAMGERSGEPELTARAWLGFANVAYTRGNYPEARRWYHAAALLADDNGCREQSFNAHFGLLGVAGIAGDHDTALVEGWKAYEFAAGNPTLEAEALANMGQALHEMGRHHTALKAFGAAIARASHPEMLLAALGGAATCAAILGSRDVVDAISRRIDRVAGAAWAYARALALLDLADARELIGEHARAAAHREQAGLIAEQHGFHALAYRAENPAVAPVVALARSPAARTSEILAEVEQLPTPEDLRVMA
jgi:tetratricopeptide (TPR) repeat protein